MQLHFVVSVWNAMEINIRNICEVVGELKQPALSVHHCLHAHSIATTAVANKGNYLICCHVYFVS